MRIRLTFTAIAACLLLSGCGCMLDPGDSRAVDDYWDGCWAEAKGGGRVH